MITVGDLPKIEITADKPKGESPANNLRRGYLPPNPYYAFIELELGDIKIYSDTRNNLIKSLNYIRSASDECANEITLVMYDDTSLVVESELIKLKMRMYGQDNKSTGSDSQVPNLKPNDVNNGSNEVTNPQSANNAITSFRVRYGYVGGLATGWLSFMLDDYSMNFDANGSTLTIKGYSQSIASAAVQHTTVRKGSISDIVRQIASEEGWYVGYIVDTAPVLNEEGNEKVFYQTAKTSPMFINDTLIPLAKSADKGNGGYVLNFDDEGSVATVNFYPATEPPASQVVCYDFTYGVGDKNQSVISFSPSYKGTELMTDGAGTLTSETMDKLSNSMYKSVINNRTEFNRSLTGTKSLYRYADSMLRPGIPIGSVDEANKLATNMWFQNSKSMYTATMDIMGDPRLGFFDNISIIVMNKYGQVHLSTGIYYVEQVTDTISGGEFTTSLDLYRNGLDIGVDEAGNLSIKATAVIQPKSKRQVNGGSFKSPSGTAEALIECARSFLDYHENEDGSSIFGNHFGNSGAWCDSFVAYCAMKVGISTNKIPIIHYVPDTVSFYKSKGAYSSGTPQIGDLVIEGDEDHIGIVTGPGTGIFGNDHDAVRERSYNATGFCHWQSI